MLIIICLYTLLGQQIAVENTKWNQMFCLCIIVISNLIYHKSVDGIMYVDDDNTLLVTFNSNRFKYVDEVFRDFNK